MLRRCTRLMVLLFVGFNASLTHAQTLNGKIFNDLDGSAVIGAEVSLGSEHLSAMTNAIGKYIINDIPPGNYTLTVSGEKIQTIEIPVEMKESPIRLDVGVKGITTKVATGASTIGVIEIEDLSNDAEQGQAEYSSLLTAGRDQFDNAAAYNLSNGRFRPRGLLNEYSDTYINGMFMNDLDDGRVGWGLWGGLNDVFRARDAKSGMQQVDYAFGNIGGTTNVDLRASSQWKQLKAVYTIGNRSYANRVMLTYGTGMMDNGWAVSLSGSRRWGDQGFIKGTHYDSYSYFLSVDRKLGDHQTLNLVVLGAPTVRGRSTASVQEAYDLAGSNFYNPLWGYQNGEVRNSREYRINQPIAMLRHDWNINGKTNLSTTFGMQTGTFGSTRLEWFNASDPRPDYYRKLPSFALSQDLEDQLTQVYQDNPDLLQINWDNLYQANYARRNNPITIEDVDGIPGNNVTGGLAAYTLDEQRFDTKKYSVNSVLQTSLTDRIELQSGAYYLYESTENYVILDDLLGAEFSVDWDDFAIRELPGDENARQNDVNRPNRIVREGDRYGFDYNINTTKVGLWSQANFVLPQFDFYVGGNFSRTSFYRDGKVRDGNFPDNSFGKSETQVFNNFGLKGGATYKINGRNYLYANGQIATRAPYSRFAYLSPRARHDVIPTLQSEKIRAIEAGYSVKYSNIKGRITAYQIQLRDQVTNAPLYFDLSNSFGNFVQKKIDKTHQGIEMGFEANLNQVWSVTGAAAIGAYHFDNRPLATLTRDNDGEILIANETIYSKNYRVPGLPQQAFTGGLNFNKNYWFANINANFFRKIFIDFFPLRRTESAVLGLDPVEDEALWSAILDQEEVDPQFTLDFFGGKSWKIDDYFLAVNVSIGNILNNTSFITGGFEQFRFDFEDRDVTRFEPRYFYSYGRNFSVNVSLRM